MFGIFYYTNIKEEFKPKKNNFFTTVFKKISTFSKKKKSE